VEAFLASRPPQVPAAIAGAAMTLNELGLLGPRRTSERAQALAASLQARVRPGGCLVFVEPGTRKGYMNLMALRDRLLHLPPLYPCPHALACPMWNGAVRHWCHATVRLPAGFCFDAALRARAGVRFEMRDLQLAAFAVQNAGVQTARAQPPPAQTEPMQPLRARAGEAGRMGEPVAPFRPRVGERVVSAPLAPRDPGPARRGGAAPAKPHAGGSVAVVLACAPDGQLHERPAPAGGPYTRGLWSAQPGAAPGASSSASSTARSGPAPAR